HGDAIPTHDVLRYSCLSVSACAPPTVRALNPYTGTPRSNAYRRRTSSTSAPIRMSLPSPITCSLTRPPSTRSTTRSGNGPSNGGGIVLVTTTVCTTPRRASGTDTNFVLPQLMQYGWIGGGVLIVPHSTHRAPSNPSISSAPRTKSALSGGTP